VAKTISQQIADELGVREAQVEATIKLLFSDATEDSIVVTLDANGFAVVNHRSVVVDFFDDDEHDQLDTYDPQYANYGSESDPNS